jgi:hypothetical protein
LAILSAHGRRGVLRADKLLQGVERLLLFLNQGSLFFDLLCLRFNLCLLLFESIDERDAQAVVFHAFDLAFVVEGDEQRIDPGNKREGFPRFWR